MEEMIEGELVALVQERLRTLFPRKQLLMNAAPFLGAFFFVKIHIFNRSGLCNFDIGFRFF